ncbi:hypothetical protein G6L37_06730 [Agrobacterium rubi]|nr:hypothetical protein [Agrobacterium rubi]NTF25059.1 hypothetical protein [Agrobacterium rubi]
MLRLPSAVLTLVFMATAAIAADWPQADVDKAIKIVDSNEFLSGCVKDSGTELFFDAKQIDLNKDGVNEIVISVRPKDIVNGSTFCFGRSGSEVHLLISDGKSGWKHQFGFDMSEPVYHKSETAWPDIEFSGAGFCFPIWRYHEGQYGMWKVCNDDGKLIYADVAPWIKEGAVPSGLPRASSAARGKVPKSQPAAWIHDDNLSGPEFMHNGSLMAVDHTRGMIIYKEPKASIAEVVRPGDVLFEAEMPWDMHDTSAKIVGNAFVFKKGCKPTAYRVEGGIGQTWHTVELTGEAPVWKKGACQISGLSKTSSNANLKFESVID